MLPKVVTVPVRPVPPETLVTVPVQVVLLLNVDQSVEDNAPLLVALAVGIFIQNSPLEVIGLPVTDISVPVVQATAPTDVTVPPASVTVKVNVSVESSVVIAIPEPAKVKVSELLSASIVVWPETATHLKIHWEEPLSLFVKVTVSPEFWFSVKSPPPPSPEPAWIHIVQLETLTVLDIVRVSVLSSVVIETPVPASMFNVSVKLSATRVDCPVEAIFLNIQVVLVTVFVDVPVTLIPAPAVTSSILELKDVQSALDNAPLLEALAVGKFKVRVPLLVIGLPVTLKSVPVVPTAPQISVTVPPESVTVNVIVSVVSSVVIAIPEPAKVTVSAFESATISFCPETANVLNIHWSEPLSVLVTVMSPLLVIGLPDTLNPPPLTKPTLVTVPVQSVLELNAVQSALDNAPLFVALAVGKLKVILPPPVIGLPDTLKSVPVVPTTAPTLVTVPVQSVLLLNKVQSVADNLPVFVALASGIDIVTVPLPVIGLPDTETSVPNSSVSIPTLVTVPVQVVLALNEVQSALDKAPRFVALAVGILIVISPLPVTGLPDTFISVPVVPVVSPTLVTVPVQVVLALKDIQSVAVSFPVAVALASGIDNVIVPLVVIGTPVTAMSVPVSLVAKSMEVTVPSAPSFEIVTVSLVASVVIVIPVPSAKVKVSALLSASIVVWPETATHLKIHWEEPRSVFVTVIVPLPVTGLPETETPVPADKPTLVTVPPQDVYPASLLNPELFIFDLQSLLWTPEESTTAK